MVFGVSSTSSSNVVVVVKKRIDNPCLRLAQRCGSAKSRKEQTQKHHDHDHDTDYFLVVLQGWQLGLYSPFLLCLSSQLVSLPFA